MLNDPGRVAWTVLITSFITFCLVITATLLGIRWFLFDSTIPLDIQLSVGRGTIGVAVGDNVEEVERTGRTLQRGVRLTTASSDQGYIAFTDPNSHTVIATLILHNDSSITLGDTARPRFDFSSVSYAIDVLYLQGRIDVEIVSELSRSIRFDIPADPGRIRMSSGGRYLLGNQNNNVTVLNRAGEAVLISQEGQARLVPEGTQGHIEANGDITVDTVFLDVLPDGSFDTVNPANPELSSIWRCYDDPSPTAGEYARESVLGRSVIHIGRLDGASSHGETGCLQYLGTQSEGLDITEYDNLELRVNMLIRYQSLSTCGQQGSECPLMLVMDYVDEVGTERQWIHGFYADHDPAQGYPLRCQTCAIDHERLNANTWYTFSSGNLIQLLPEDQRPSEILYVKFYASGHQYEVMLNEVALLAGETPQTAEETN